MPSRTSFFNNTVFWADQRHFWPLTAGYALLWLLLLPFSTLSQYSYMYGSPDAESMRFDTLRLAGTAGYWVAFFVSILFAMAMFSYLTNPRATCGIHALPARRETLFVTHFAAGLAAQLAVQLLAVLLTATVLASHNAADARMTGLSLLALVLPTLFFYSFGVLCMMFTGQILAAPVFYFVLNVLVVGVELLLRSFAGTFLYGWTESGYLCLIPCSPIVQLVRVGVRASNTAPVRTAEGLQYVQDGGLHLHGLEWLCLYALVGVVCAVLALLIYRARHSEATGGTVAIGWARPVFKYGVSFCAALALGQLFYYLFFGQYRSPGNYSLAGTVACMAAAGLIGYFAAEMLLKKSFRVWKSGRVGAAATVAALVLLGVALSFDLTGYEGSIPDAEQIEWASINSYGSKVGGFSTTVRDDETLRLLTQAHRAVVLDKHRQLSCDFDAYDAPMPSGVVSAGFFVDYHLKDGRTVSRSYNTVYLFANELDNEASPAAAITALYNAPEVALKRTLGRYGFNDAVDDPRALEDLRFTDGYADSPLRDDVPYPRESGHSLSGGEAKEVFDAVLRDVKAGRAETSLFTDTPLAGSVVLYATCRDTGSDREERPDTDAEGRVSLSFDLSITEKMTDTVLVLRSMGVELEF